MTELSSGRPGRDLEGRLERLRLGRVDGDGHIHRLGHGLHGLGQEPILVYAGRADVHVDHVRAGGNLVLAPTCARAPGLRQRGRRPAVFLPVGLMRSPMITVGSLRRDHYFDALAKESGFHESGSFPACRGHISRDVSTARFSSGKITGAPIEGPVDAPPIIGSARMTC